MNTGAEKGQLLLEVNSVSKKFSRNLHWSMIHGMNDMGRLLIGRRLQKNDLRQEEFWAVKQVSLDLKKGEILSVLGNNGSGKTTLMRMISGIYPVDQGSINVYGSVASLFALKTGMHPHFTGRENIYIKAGMFGMSREILKEKIKWIIDFSELGKFIDAPYGSYSSGMQSRLGYSIAAATEPQILIIDEGLSVGDVSFRAKCYDNLRRLSPNCGIIFITHNLKRIENLATHLIILESGEVVYRSSDVKSGITHYMENFTKLNLKSYLD